MKERTFRIRYHGQISGPVTAEKLRSLIARGQITPMHELSTDFGHWKAAEQLEEFFPKPNPSEQETLLQDNDIATNRGNHGGTASVWYAHIDGEKKGPVPPSQLLSWKLGQRLRKNTLVWKQGMPKWLPAKKVIPALFNDPNSVESIQREHEQASDEQYRPREIKTSEDSRNHRMQFGSSYLGHTNAPLPVGYSIAAMVLGVSSIVTCLGLILGIPAIMMSLLSLSRINRGIAGGRNMAITGLTTGVVSSIISLIFLLWVFLIVGWGAIQTYIDAAIE